MTTLFISLCETSIFRGMCRWLKDGQHRISSLSFDSANVLIRFRFMHGKHFVMFHRVEKHVRKTDGCFCAWVYGMGMYCNQKGARSVMQSQSATRRDAKRRRHGDVSRLKSGAGTHRNPKYIKAAINCRTPKFLKRRETRRTPN